MTAWHVGARFDVLGKRDVFIEDDHFLYVEDQAFNYHGYYVCRECRIVEKLDGSRIYLLGDCVAADNEYVKGLNVANWEIAREIIAFELERWQKCEELMDGCRDEDEKNAGIIEDARRCLLDYAESGEVYTYC